MVAWSKLAATATSPSHLAFLSCSAAGVATLYIGARALSSGKKLRELGISASSAKERSEKAAVDGVFFKRILRILRIIVPRWFCAESGFLGLVAAALIARTYCDVWMISNGTAIEASIIGRNMGLFRKNIFHFMTAMPIIAIINTSLKFGLNELKLRFRSRLTRSLYQQYLQGFTYYKMSNLDNRIANADQLLTQDVEKFCNSIAELYSNVVKPFLDIVIYFHKLTGSIGLQGPMIMLGYLAVSGLILTRLRRPVARMTVGEQRLEGEFRFVNSRLITNSEEIAFYQGNRRESITVHTVFDNLVAHLRSFIQFRFSMGFLDSVIAKYVATVVGYSVVSRPFLNLDDPRHMHSSHSEMMKDYYKSGRMLVKMAEAIGRLVLAGREMTRLSGFTARVTQLMDVLDDLNRGIYQRTMVTTSSDDDSPPLVPGSGEIIEQDHIIRFEKVPLATPNGDVLVKELTFEVQSGMNLLVCGPNGCGKSSLFRVVGELWPLFGGRVTKPNKRKLFYIPQRPYMTIGTLRDQIIYPDCKEDMEQKGITDQQLVAFLEQVHLTNLLERDGQWDAVHDWMDVLSGGEKQRVAMARLFYHRPQFAILDECTSAVSVDVEGFMYSHCREVGITLFTVSHRKTLWKYHEYVLQFDGRGAFEFRQIDSSTDEFGS